MTCQQCGGRASKVGAISWSGLCRTCAKDNQNDNLDAMVTMSGPRALHWRQRLAASVGAVFLDRPPPRA